MSRKRIQVLPPHIVNRIAAGEVVERPASVVKELVENSVDAGAGRIEVFAGAGGRNIRVADNGSGMTPDDALLAFYNHATSKVTEETDLSRIETLGFRGEALASISAISRVTCLTRTAEAPVGTKAVLDELGEPTLSETGCSPGTVLEVADLFYNTPARLKFLKRPQTELGHIEEVIQHLALSHPEIQFSLTMNELVSLKTRGSGELKSAIEEVFRLNRKEVSDLIGVKREEEGAGLSLAGYISPPGVLKSSKRWMVMFVNGRSVKCPVLTKAVEAAYASLIPDGKYPLAVLFLNLPPEEVDVNVHPTKKEVRYAKANSIFGFVRQSLLATLEDQGHHAYASPPPLATSGMEGSQPVQLSHFHPMMGSHAMPTSPGTGKSYGSFPGPRLSSGPSAGYPDAPRAAFSFYEPPADSPVIEAPRQPQWRVIGQLFNTYILIETRQGLMVVDQHIASERTFFEALTQATLGETPDMQNVMALAPLSISPVQHDLLSENRERFTRLGFAYELSDTASEAGPTVILTGLPIIFQDRQPRDLFTSLLTQLEETGEMKLDLDHMIATLSCHSAVRAGDVLSEDEMNKVIARWLACRLPWTCPHGRPIAHTIATEELNHFFHRPSLPVNAI